LSIYTDSQIEICGFRAHIWIFEKMEEDEISVRVRSNIDWDQSLTRSQEEANGGKREKERE
jgi:hypothetical protein